MYTSVAHKVGLQNGYFGYWMAGIGDGPGSRGRYCISYSHAFTFME